MDGRQAQACLWLVWSGCPDFSTANVVIVSNKRHLAVAVLRELHVDFLHPRIDHVLSRDDRVHIQREHHHVAGAAHNACRVFSPEYALHCIVLNELDVKRLKLAANQIHRVCKLACHKDWIILDKAIWCMPPPWLLPVWVIVRCFV